MKQKKKQCPFGRVLASVLAGAASLATSHADITSNLIAHWKFDEPSGVIASDSSGQNNHATLWNFQADDSMWVTGRLGGALQFNIPDGGDDDAVITDNPIVLNNQDSFTFAVWAKRQPGANPFNPRFITPVGADHWVLWSPGIGVGFYVPAPTADPPTGAWRHYVVLCDRAASRYSVYVDGTKVVTDATIANGRAEPGDVQWVIGHKELLEDHRDPWRGFLDDMRMYNRILTDADVKELYAQAAAEAPSIVTQPLAGSRFVGDAHTFSVVADGTAPISFQWSKDGTAIAGATNSTLVLTNLQVSNTGNYSVALTNSVGSAASTSARLEVTDPPVDIASDLVMHFKFDETSGLAAADASGKGNNATLQWTTGDGSEWVPGRMGGGLQLNPVDGGNDDYAVTDNPVALQNQNKFTFTFWAKLAPGSGVNPRIITPVGTQHWVLWTPGTGVGFHLPAASPEPILDLWRHFAVVYDREAGTYQVYVDGKRAGNEVAGRVRAEPGESQWIIGHAENIEALSDAFAGTLDELRVYNRQLSPKDIAAIYALAPSLAPRIITQPKGIIAAAGSPVSLVLSAEGTDLAYQWKKNGVDIPGATSSQLSFASAATTDTGSYTVTVRNNDGQLESSAATVTIIPVLNLSSAPTKSSGNHSDPYQPSHAFDGLRRSNGPDSSRWASPADGVPHWIYVDLGEDVTLRHVLLDWEGAYGIDYTLRGRTSAEGPSDDPLAWTELAGIYSYAQSNHGLDGADVVFDFVNHSIVLQSSTAEAPVTNIVNTAPRIRYLMLDGQMSALNLFSVWELQVNAEGSTVPSPTLAVTRNGNTVTINWPADATGFTLESTDSLPSSSWTAVSGVANNSITVNATATKFYRLRR